ncbi:MAG: hypothetical protein V9E94_13530 [Microthrixaceae bacterium]
MGVGYATGEGRSLHAARHAISSPLLEAAIDGARGILLNISGGSDLTLFEVNEAASVIHEVAHPEANIIFGAVIDDEMGDEVRITVVAAGFERWDESKSPRRAETAAATPAPESRTSVITDVFADSDDEDESLFDGDDDFDVPSFLK